MVRIRPWSFFIYILCQQGTTTTTTTTTTSTASTTTTATYHLGRGRGRGRGLRAERKENSTRACLHLLSASFSLCCSCRLMPTTNWLVGLFCPRCCHIGSLSYGETTDHARGRRSSYCACFLYHWACKTTSTSRSWSTIRRSNKTSFRNSKRRPCLDHILHVVRPRYIHADTHMLWPGMSTSLFSMPSILIFHSNPYCILFLTYDRPLDHNRLRRRQRPGSTSVLQSPNLRCSTGTRPLSVRTVLVIDDWSDQ